jgi:hypothetical protein
MGRNATLKKQRNAERRERSRVEPARPVGRDDELIEGGRSWVHAALLCVLTFVVSIFLIESEDIFSNIVTGEYLWKHRTVPEFDPFSFTGPYPWLLNRPLPSLAFYAVHTLGGLPAIQMCAQCNIRAVL